MDREDREDKYLQIRKKGLNGNVFTVFGEEQGPQRADLSYWAAQGELVFDLRINSAEEAVEFLVKLDSGWPNVSDYSVKLPEKGAWETIRVPVRDILANSNRFSPGGYADINKMVNLVYWNQRGPCLQILITLDLKSIRNLHRKISQVGFSAFLKIKNMFQPQYYPIPVLSQFDTSREVPIPL